MTEQTPAMVAVPVELLKEWRDKFQHMGYMPTAGVVEALLPKPKPRLVAFDYEEWMEGSQSVEEYRDSKPDLLTALDRMVEGWNQSEGVTAHIKRQFRTALGVDQ